jgi:predicted transcriptional regulator YdeE
VYVCIEIKIAAMEKINLNQEIKVFGIQVKTFPAGIGEAFEGLIKMIPGGFNRSYYGISYMDPNGAIIYYATAAETTEGEAEKYHCERCIIESGEYLSVTVNQWRDKTGCIKDVFHEIMKEGDVDNTKPAVEWYKNDDEMLCMIRTITNK